MKKTISHKPATKFVPASNTPNPLLNAMQVQSNFTTTENGAITNKSTLNDILDFFGAGGALRSRTDEDVIRLFSRAFAQDRLTALKILFYFRDVRSGQGERKTFRTIFKWLGENYSDIAEKNLTNVPFYGRYDDLYSLVGTPLEAEAFELISNQLKLDLKNMKAQKPVSLLAKWLKSENASSPATVELGHKTRKALELSSKRYRKVLSALRAYINVLEVKMCAGDWNEIDFEKVPSKASMTYRKAFGRHDQERYAAYLKAVEKGEAKINAGAVYPYEIFRSLIGAQGHNTPTAQDIKQADLQWKAMPNFLEGHEHYGLVIADTSGSMTDHGGLPILVSVSLAIYFAERNTGPFKDFWINFSDNPTFQKLVGNNLFEKFKNMDKTNWDQSTNLQSAFDLILNTAVSNGVKETDMPTALYIVSDMEFNNSGRSTNYETIKAKYAKHGYKLPRLIWWNVAARNDQHPIRSDDNGTALVSGASPSILKSLLSAKSFDPLSIVYETINNKRYDMVVI